MFKEKADLLCFYIYSLLAMEYFKISGHQLEQMGDSSWTASLHKRIELNSHPLKLYIPIKNINLMISRD